MFYNLKSHQTDNQLDAISVRLIGLEPTQPELPDPKSGASTNFATGAWGASSEDVLRLRIIKSDFVLRSACTIVAFSEDVLRLRIIKQDLFSIRLTPSFAGAKVVIF